MQRPVPPGRRGKSSKSKFQTTAQVTQAVENLSVKKDEIEEQASSPMEEAVETLSVHEKDEIEEQEMSLKVDPILQPSLEEAVENLSVEKDEIEEQEMSMDPISQPSLSLMEEIPIFEQEESKVNEQVELMEQEEPKSETYASSLIEDTTEPEEKKQETSPVEEMGSIEPVVEEVPAQPPMRRRSSYLEVGAVPYHPIHLLEPCTKVPEIPDSVDTVASDMASTLLRAIMKVVRVLVNKDKEKVDEFKINARLFGTDFMDANDYFNYLQHEFGALTALMMIPCVLQLQPNAHKVKTLLSTARQYTAQNMEQLEALVVDAPVATGCLFGIEDQGLPPRPPPSVEQSGSMTAAEEEERTSSLQIDCQQLMMTRSMSVSSLLSPSVARQRQLAREQSDTPDHLQVGSFPFMMGQLNIKMYGSQEQLDQDSGKFYTEYLIQCSWSVPGTENSNENWLVSRRYREFQAMDILLREMYPILLQFFQPLPGKRYLGSSLSADFVDKRQKDLAIYITTLLQNFPMLVDDGTVDSFLELKRNVMMRTRRKMQRQAVLHGPRRVAIEEQMKKLQLAKIDTTTVGRALDTESFLLLEEDVRKLTHILQTVTSENVLSNVVLETTCKRCMDALPNIRATAQLDISAHPRLVPLAKQCESDLVQAITLYYQKLMQFLN